MKRFLKASLGMAALLAFGAALISPVVADEEVPDLRNAKCPISGKPTVAAHFAAYSDADKGVHAKVHFCCPNCKKAAESGDLKALYTKAYLTKKDGTTAEYGKPVADLKNEVCPVGGDKTEGAGQVNFNGVAVRMCCPSCDEEFIKNSEKYLPKLKAEIAKLAEEQKKAEAAK